MSFINFVENIPGQKPDKYDLGYVKEIYNDFFTPRKNNCKKILEIGIQYGLSLLLWEKYFVNADIYGIDVEYCHHVTNSSRIHPYFKDAYCKDSVEMFEPSTFDIIIDDGPHTLESMIYFCKNYFQLVKPGGLFIIEDIIDISWTPILINFFEKRHLVKVYHMAGKCLNDELNHKWKNGLDVVVVEKKRK